MLVKILGICLTLLLSVQCFAQETNHKRILGTWTVSKIEFLRTNKDSANIINNANRTIVTFSADSVTVKIKFDTTFTRTSTYTISPDGSTLTHNGVTATIARLTDEELILNIPIEAIIEHLKRVH